MMQILGVNGALFGILTGLFGTVAKIYDIMLSLTGYFADGGSPDNYVIITSTLTTTMYTLAGVFMLFRVTVAMINMLIEPDRINDNQVGAGKMVTRIITSIALLIMFVPTGWIFNKNPDNPGILMRLEKALLAEDGLINKMMPQIGGDNVKLNSSNKNELFISNVYADPNPIDCYYVHITHSSQGAATQNADNGNTPSSDVSITHVIHLSFYDDKTTGTSGKICPGDYKLLNCNYSYTSDSSDGYNKSFKGKLTWEQTKKNPPSSYSCPKRINDKKFYKNYKKGKTWKDGGSSYVGGWSSLEEMKKDVQDSGIVAAGKNGAKIAQLLGIGAEGYLSGISNEAIAFSRNTLSSFVECNSNDSSCKEKLELMLFSRSANSDIAKDLDSKNPTMRLDFLAGVIAGIGLIIWISVLCVDVIIRRFKLMLLEIISPIPIISYVDPKDDTFSKWGKMYIATYLDLFLKLIAISFAIVLLKQVREAIDGSGLLIFFYIIAILVFAKLVPSMISKIFNIDSLGGSFKDIVGMGKKVLGAGVGAVGAAGATLAVGAMAARSAGVNRMDRKKLNNLKQKADAGDVDAKQQLAEYRKGRQDRAIASAMTGASTFASFFKGGVAGSQGKLSSVVTAAKEGATIQSDRKAQYVAGLSPTDLITANTVGKVGMDYASRVDREVAPLLERKEVADGVPKILDVPFAAYKKSGFAMTLDSLLQNRKITGNQHKTLTKDYLDWQSTLLEGAYGQVVNGELTGKLDENKIMQAVNAGTITEKRANDILMNDAKFRAAMRGEGELANLGLAGDVKVEVGIQNTLATAIDTVNAKAQGSGYYADAIGNPENPIVDYSGLDGAVNAAYGKSKDLSAEINAKTVGDSRYVTSKAANQTAGNDKK